MAKAKKLKYSKEQTDVTKITANARVDAVAGSGKTSSLVGLAENNKKKSILYLCFNKSVKEEAVKKFPENVAVKNYHSLAYQEMQAWKYKIANNLDPFDIVEILQIPKHNTDNLFQVKVAALIIKLLEIYFCHSSRSIDEIDFLKYHKTSFAKENYSIILEGAKKIYKKMADAEIDIVHNFYLKEYQLSDPVLDYDIILGDESQDFNDAMLDVFSKQDDSIKVAVGDRFQSIYGFNYAINALEKLPYDHYQLTKSFRFGKEIADLAKAVLGLYSHFTDIKIPEIIGVGSSKDENSYAVIARKNSSLLAKAFDAIDLGAVKKISFEGDLNNYIFSDEGGSIYDIYNVYMGKSDKCNSPFLKRFKSYRDLKDYLEECESTTLSVLCGIVEKYKGGIFGLIKELKNRNTTKEKSDIIYSTLHKCKGMEYDSVEICDDFIYERNLLDGSWKDRVEDALQEINMLYVATTRAKNKIHFPQFLNREINLATSKLLVGSRKQNNMF